MVEWAQLGLLVLPPVSVGSSQSGNWMLDEKGMAR